MKGSIKRRGKSWRGRIDVGVDPRTGNRRFRSVTRRTKDEVQKELARIRTELEAGDYVDPSKVTFGEWLELWYSSTVATTTEHDDGTTTIAYHKRKTTAARYRGIIDHYLTPSLGHLKLQKLRAHDLDKYYRDSKLQPSGLELHHVVIRSALASAKKKRLVTHNEAELVESRPGRGSKGDDDEARELCWSREESLAFLKVAKAAGPQQAAFYSLLLEIGLRKNEAAALLWSDVDLDAGTICIRHQLTKGGEQPEFGPLKSGAIRTLDISAELVELLCVAKSHQAKLKLKNRVAYRDHGLVFAREWKDLSRGRARLGDPLLTNNIGQREFAKLVEESGVKRIKFHGLRHTSATLALLAGVELKVVSYRLGHANVGITADVYSHAISEIQKGAAQKMGSLLHG